MYKLMIAEDEEIVRSGLKNGTDWCALGFEVVGTASNGMEALELVENLTPDAVLTDIRMPDMDGIALMKILHQQYPEVEIVILSGYSDFEYARSAVKYGAYEYLTKPVDDPEFQRVFQGLREKIRDKRRRLYTGNREENGEQKLDPEKLRDIFLSTLVSKPLDDRFIRKSVQELKINIHENCFCIAAMQLDPAEPCCSIQLSDLLKEKYIGPLTTYKYPFVVLDRACIIFLSSKSGGSLFDFKKEMNRYKEFLREALQAAYASEVHISIGISKLHSGLKDIRAAFQEASTALQFKFYCGNGSTVCYSDMIPNITASIECKTLDTLLSKLTEAFFSTNRNQLSKGVRDLFDFIKQVASADVTYIRIKCMEILIMLDNKLKEKGIPLEELAGKETIYSSIFQKSTIHELQHWFHSKLDRAMASAGSASVEQAKDIVRLVKEYIYANIGDKIALHDIAKAVHMSPNYLSSIFARDTGLNLSRYIMDLKVERAQELLARSDLRIQEISDQLGFSDYRYFSTVFKKETGLTPLDYRARNHR